MNIEGNLYPMGPMLYRSKIPTGLVDQLLERGNKSNLDYRDQLAGILEKESAYPHDDKEFFAREIEPCMTDFMRAFDTYYQQELLAAPQSRSFELMDLWINYMHCGDFNPPHIHFGDFSFVIYLQVPEQIREEFENHKNVTGNRNGPGCIEFLCGMNVSWFSNKAYFFPEVGDIFIFPADLYHTVAPFKSDVVRISVSGNLGIRAIQNEHAMAI